MTDQQLALAVAAALITTVGLLGVAFFKFIVESATEVERFRADFQRFRQMFPNTCMVCSYHRYGQANGYIDAAEPLPKHSCLERSYQKTLKLVK